MILMVTVFLLFNYNALYHNASFLQRCDLLPVALNRLVLDFEHRQRPLADRVIQHHDAPFSAEIGGVHDEVIVKSLTKSNKDKEPKQQGIHISQPPLFPQPLDPCPGLLYRVEIRAIGRKPQHRMSLSL